MSRIFLRLCLALAIAIVFASPVRADSVRGTWNLTNVHGMLQLEMQWHGPNGHGDSEHSSFVDAQSLGIASALNSSGRHTTFALHREAGDFAFEGWVGNGEGAGSYTFTPNDAFFSSLSHRGYNVNTIDYKVAFADLDITGGYIDQMESFGFKGDVNNLVAMKALAVSPQYVHELQTAGVTGVSESQVISLRALRVDASYINEIAAAGYPHLSAGQYVTLKAMHVDGAYIRYLRGHGFKNLTIDQVVSMKAERI